VIVVFSPDSAEQIAGFSVYEQLLTCLRHSDDLEIRILFQLGTDEPPTVRKSSTMHSDR